MPTPYPPCAKSAAIVAHLLEKCQVSIEKYVFSIRYYCTVDDDITTRCRAFSHVRVFAPERLQANMYTTDEHRRIPDTPISFLYFVSRPHWPWVLAAAFGITMAQAFASSIPYIFQLIIDTAHGVADGRTTTDEVWQWGLVYLGAVAGLFAGFRLSGFLGMRWMTRLNETAYNTLFSYIAEHSHTYFSDRFAGSLLSKMSNASEGSQSLSEAFLWNYYPSILSFIFTTIYMATASPFAAGLFFALLCVLVPLNVYLAKKRRPYVVQFSQDATTARGRAVDAFANITAVRQFARRAYERAYFGASVNTMRLSNIRQWSISESILVVNNIIILAFEAIILLVMFNLWTAGRISIGELVMVVTLLISTQGTLVFIGSSMNGFIRRYGEIEEGLSDILVPHDILDRADAVPLTVSDGTIAFDDVSFQFDQQSVFSHLNLSIPAGQRIGLVGPSGAGKTTFVSLLLRQHELTDGVIRIDGQDIASVTQDSLRSAIAVVPQEPLLFHRSIRENIAYGNPAASDAEIEAAAQDAQAHEFIMALPEGYDTLVGERGVKLSGGQRQRVAIARAMLKDAPILILDEATSALDSESEVAIQQALHRLMEGKTVIAIAHRLSTLREMDRIIVLENGAVVEDGTHAELVGRGGLYATLWEHQAGGFITEG